MLKDKHKRPAHRPPTWPEPLRPAVQIKKALPEVLNEALGDPDFRADFERLLLNWLDSRRLI